MVNTSEFDRREFLQTTALGSSLAFIGTVQADKGNDYYLGSWPFVEVVVKYTLDPDEGRGVSTTPWNYFIDKSSRAVGIGTAPISEFQNRESLAIIRSYHSEMVQIGETVGPADRDFIVTQTDLTNNPKVEVLPINDTVILPRIKTLLQDDQTLELEFGSETFEVAKGDTIESETRRIPITSRDRTHTVTETVLCANHGTMDFFGASGKVIIPKNINDKRIEHLIERFRKNKKGEDSGELFILEKQ